MAYQFKNILITGAAGFIGSNFVRYMLETYSDISIVSLDKLTYAGTKANLVAVEQAANYVFVEGDILDKALVLSLMQKYEIDTIVHFAAESHVDNSINNPGVFLETNVMGTFALLETARHYWLETLNWNTQQCRFHHVSTDEVYGSLTAAQPAFTETSLYQPNSPYSASKASSDHLVRAYYHTYQLPVTTSNCSNNYGPCQHSEKLIPTVINACLEQRAIPIYGNGSNVRDWLYVLDHCSAIDLIIREGKVGEVYNIGGNNELDNLSLVKKICQLMDDFFAENAPHESLITYVQDRKGHDQRYAIDNTKISTELGWAPQGDFINKLIDTIRFYLNKN